MKYTYVEFLIDWVLWPTIILFGIASLALQIYWYASEPQGNWWHTVIGAYWGGWLAWSIIYQGKHFRWRRAVDREMRAAAEARLLVTLDPSPDNLSALRTSIDKLGKFLK